MKICYKCGTTLERGDKYCMECGIRYVEYEENTISTKWLTVLLILAAIALIYAYVKAGGAAQYFFQTMWNFIVR